MKRPWCSGEGGLARPKEPSDLVTCEHCGRAGLGGERPGAHGIFDSDHIRDRDGNWRLVVPRHREGPRTKEWQARQAERANMSRSRPDLAEQRFALRQMRANADLCDDTDVYPGDYW